MRVGTALLVGAVLLLLVVDGVLYLQRDFRDDGVDLVEGGKQKGSDYSIKAAGIDNNRDPPNNEVPDYGNNKRSRSRRSIKKKLADKIVAGKARLQRDFLLTHSDHKIRHRHRFKQPPEEIFLLNATFFNSSEQIKSLYQINDSRTENERWKRYSYITKDGVVHYTYPAVPCNSWGYYGPYRCIPCQCTRENCIRPCVGPRTYPGQPFPTSSPSFRPPGLRPGPAYVKPTTQPPPIYSGPGKYWIGPRLGCNCNLRGSELSTCDITTGQCRCKPFYMGRTCDRCQDGYWESINGCIKCECDPDGSKSNSCNQRTGQCECKPGIGGLRCDACLLYYYGFSVTGCKACEPCNKKGHICDPDTGRCICPPYSHGEFCHLCSSNTWGYEPNKGCKMCNCSASGSSKMQCNVSTGECSCRLGYTGFRCEHCAHGYFGYPRCRRCNCNFAGTDKYTAKCDKSGVCQCNEDGGCPCKANVFGKKCEECRDGTFGLHMDNPDGCTQCFCFGRSSKCTEAGLTWGQIRTNSSRTLTSNATEKRKHTIGRITQDELEVYDKLLVIPGVHGNVTINRYHFDIPLFWKLHPVFIGDRILSYGGYLRFISRTYNSKQRLPQETLNHYPLVQLRSQGKKIVLEYYPPLPTKTDKHEIRLHESLWKRIYPKETNLSPRELLMIALQHVDNIFIKATDSSSFQKIALQDVVLDTAIEVPGHPPPLAKGVEMCECPRQYNSSSCQNPSIGFFRHKLPSVNGTILIDAFIGQAKPCKCNGRSSVCNIETGYCLNCTAHTDGHYCEKCTDGYYGNPMLPFGKCEPCPCPSVIKNFAKECKPLSKTKEFSCKCKPGYSGQKCDKCSLGYYGQLDLPGGSCQPCNCHPEGKASDECDSVTGQCNCKPGVIGKQCSQCEKPRHVLEKFKCTPCDTCTQWLLNDIDRLYNELHSNTSFLQNETLEPPWNTLEDIEKRYVYLNDELASRLELIAQEPAIKTALDELQDRLNTLQKELDAKNPEGVVQKEKDLLKEAQQVSKDILDSKDQLDKIIQTLENFGTSHISVKEAVKQAHELMRQIEDIAKDMKKYKHKEVHQKCADLIQFIENMTSKTSTDPNSIWNQLNELNRRIEDFENIISDIRITNREAELLNINNELSLLNLTKKLEDSTNSYNNLEDEIYEVKKVNGNTTNILKDADACYRNIDKTNLDILVKELEERKSELSEFDTTGILERVENHVLELEQNATQISKLLNLTSKEIDAVKVQEAYASIIENVNEAEKLANHSLSKVNSALDVLSPAGKDSIDVNTTISMADSERLLIRINHQLENLASIKQRKNSLALQVNDVDINNWSNGVSNSNQDAILRNMTNSLSKVNEKKIESLIEDAMEQTRQIKDVHRRIADIKISKQYELDKPLQRLLNLTTTENLRKIQEQINITNAKLQEIFAQNYTYLDVIKKHTAHYPEFKIKNDSISTKLEELKAKIDSARKMADNIRISLSGSSSSSPCWRSYALNNLSPSLFTKLTVKFNYTYSESDQGYSLFYLPTAKEQFMLLKIVNNVLTFEWKLGNDTNALEYPLSQNDFYTVEIERIGDHIEMTVGNDTLYSNTTSETAIFAATSSDLAYVGKGPNTRDGIPNCIRDIIFDKHVIGLWNFQNSSGECVGCIRTNEPTVQTYDLYTGVGYSIVSQEHQGALAKPHQFNVQFFLRTFDENALLFLAADPERKNYVAVTLKDGHIHYQVHYPSHEDIIITTKEKYNNGEKVKVSAEKSWSSRNQRDDAVLKMNDKRSGDLVTRQNIGSDAVMRLRKVNYYFGGVPPGYFLESNDSTESLHTHESLLGGLEDVREYQLFNDDTIKKYAVTRQTGELEFRKVWFEGMGYVELKTQPINSELLFVLRTKESNCFVMFIKDFILITIKEGKVHMKLYAWNSGATLNSLEAVNDDEYYLIQISKHKNKIALKRNGINQETVELADANRITTGEIIYIGGFPKDISVISDITSSFIGGISDIIIDNKLLQFNKETIKSFANVKIGRDVPTLQKIPKNLQKPSAQNHVTTHNDGNTFNMKEMQNTEGCGAPLTYTFDPSAAKFGDKPHSHVLHFLKDSFWKKEYTLEIQFRTLQPNGLLFMSYGPRQHFNVLEIKNGRILFKTNGKRLKQVNLPQKIDDGQWYNIILEATGLKKKRKLVIAINGYRTKPLRPPKNKLQRELYIGGISENVSLPSIIRNELTPFRGCIRGLKLNKIPQGLVRDKNTIHHNIGQCFPTIEKGSYFGGDAYAIYNKLFHIDKILELSLEFRTTEQNGILLSISNPRNSPALSVELQNGAIVMTTDNGYGTITNVTNNLSDFALCNNQWHNITAVYTSSEITINVDGIRKIWVQPDDETLIDELEAPLYIGGLPEYAPVGTLKMKENFRGCIKNLRIGEDKIDWLQMDKITNILLDSCPTVT